MSRSASTSPCTAPVRVDKGSSNQSLLAEAEVSAVPCAPPSMDDLETTLEPWGAAGGAKVVEGGLLLALAFGGCAAWVGSRGGGQES